MFEDPCSNALKALTITPQHRYSSMIIKESSTCMCKESFAVTLMIGLQYHGENKLIFNEMMMRSALY